MKTPNRVRGIDLGTSHCSLAFAETGQDLQIFAIPQLDGPGRILEHEQLPSVVYLAHANEIAAHDRSLAWSPEGEAPVVGRWARDLSLLNPERAILSAKSWLCYAHPQKRITLPLEAAPENAWTPVQASAAYLRHLQAAWQNKFGFEPVEQTVLTVPASFDLNARQLTEEAAKLAGLGPITLLEEPLAAFYAWLSVHESNWQEQLKPGDLVLICDIGGGTSDFSLIAVSSENRQLRLDRIAVGRHLLLGGDNMDLALAHYCQSQLLNTPLDHWQSLALQQEVRLAKEALLGPNPPESWPIAIASRSSNLFQNTLRCEISRAIVMEILLEGFLPFCPLHGEKPKSKSSGLARLGLPYETDPAISRHLAAFLQEAHANVGGSRELQERLGSGWSQEDGALKPTAILFNGGVFQSEEIRKRTHALVQSFGESPLRELASPGYDRAVALGAAAYARYQAEGRGFKVRAASPRSYYIGLESNEPAVPGKQRHLRGLCVLPQGVEEGSKLSLPEQEFGLWTGESMSFRLFSSKARSSDHLGTLVNNAEAELDEVAELRCTIEAGDEDGLLPVHLSADLTELGSLQLAMQHSLSERSWQLEFQLRDESHVGS